MLDLSLEGKGCLWHCRQLYPLQFQELAHFYTTALCLWGEEDFSSFRGDSGTFCGTRAGNFLSWLTGLLVLLMVIMLLHPFLISVDFGLGASATLYMLAFHKDFRCWQ